jgi:hypothetical protein
METLRNEVAVARMCEVVAVNAAKAYLAAHNLKADTKALAECLKSWISAKLPEAINDAMDAYKVGMKDVGDATFKATMAQAGIEAAKEAGFPK